MIIMEDFQIIVFCVLFLLFVSSHFLCSTLDFPAYRIRIIVTTCCHCTFLVGGSDLVKLFPTKCVIYSISICRVARHKEDSEDIERML